MNFFRKKLPRGVIYHSLPESALYLARSLFSRLNDDAQVRAFEMAFAAYCERKYCVVFPFARMAIYFVLKHLNLPKGSEVLLPPITIKAIVDVILELGLLPRYVDVDPATICFQFDDLKSKISPVTKVAIITPLFGLVPDVWAMVSLLKEHGIFVIEDFSQCLNGRFDGKRVGTFGDVGIYSSSSIKTLDTLGGGLAVMDNENLNDVLRKAQSELKPPDRKFLIKKAWINFVRNFATTQPWFSFLTFPALQILRVKDPGAALKQTGHRDKSRLKSLPELWVHRYTSVQAGIGLAHLGRVKADDMARIANVEYVKANSGIERFPVTTLRSSNIYWQLIMSVPDAVAAQSFFAVRGVDTATSSLELVCALQDYPNRDDLPLASEIYRNGIFIPCYPELSRKDLERVVNAVCEYFKQDHRV